MYTLWIGVECGSIDRYRAYMWVFIRVFHFFTIFEIENAWGRI